jgi:hypothetical protein
MKWFFKSKDGGPESNVTGYWLFESKRFASIALLRFDEGSREAFHNHAFNAWSWVISGELEEHILAIGGGGFSTVNLLPSFRPIFTSRNRMHKVYGKAKRTWAISFRGPWDKTWKEYLPQTDEHITLTHGRKVVK